MKSSPYPVGAVQRPNEREFFSEVLGRIQDLPEGLSEKLQRILEEKPEDRADAIRRLLEEHSRD